MTATACLFLIVLLLGPVSAIASPFAADAVVGSDGVQRATIETDSYSFTPGHLVVKAGKPVELTFKSVTWVVPHNVIIDDPKSGLKIHEEVPAGESVTIKFTPREPGTFAIYCDKKLPFMKSHRDKGQEMELEVKP